MLRPLRSHLLRLSGYLIKGFLLALFATLILVIILGTFADPELAVQLLNALRPLFYKAFIVSTSFTFFAVVLESFR
jgi:hypothetical protein